MKNDSVQNIHQPVRGRSTTRSYLSVTIVSLAVTPQPWLLVSKTLILPHQLCCEILRLPQPVPMQQLESPDLPFLSKSPLHSTNVMAFSHTLLSSSPRPDWHTPPVQEQAVLISSLCFIFSRTQIERRMYL